MAELPDVGGDVDQWGSILNTFLEQSHNQDGSLLPAAVGSAGAGIFDPFGAADGHVPLSDGTDGFNGSYYLPQATNTVADLEAILQGAEAIGGTVTGDSSQYVVTGGNGILRPRPTIGPAGFTPYFSYPVRFLGPGIGIKGFGSALTAFVPPAGMEGTALFDFTDPNFNGDTGAGAIGGFRIDGSVAGDGCTGIRLGDRIGQYISDVQVNNFRGAESIGWEFYNRYGWTERAVINSIANANSRQYVFHSDIGIGSFEYSQWNLTLTALANQNGVEFIGSHGPNFLGSHLTIRGNCLSGVGSNTGVGLTFGATASGIWKFDVQLEADLSGSGLVGHTSLQFDPATHVQLTDGSVVQFVTTNGIHWQPSNYESTNPQFFTSGRVAVDNDPALGQMPFGVGHTVVGGWSETTVPFTSGQIPITLGNIFTTTLTNGVNNLSFVGQRTDTVSFSSSSSFIADTSVGANDFGKLAEHPNFPIPSFVGTVTPGSGFVLSSSPFTQANATPTGSGSSAIIGGVTPLGRAGRYRFLLKQPASGSNPGTLGSLPFTMIGSSALSPNFGDENVLEAFTIDGVQFFAYVVRVSNNTPQTFNPVQACSIVNHTSLATLLTIDGYVLQYNDRVLLLGQTTTNQNGVWLARTGGWVRPGDFQGSILSGATVNVAGGGARFNTSWMLEGNGSLATGSILVDTDPQVWINRNPGPSRLLYKGTKNVTMGVNGVPGSPTNWNPDTSAVGILPAQIVVAWSGTFTGGETATLSVTATYSDATTSSAVTSSATAVSTGTALGQVAMSNLMKDGVYITQIEATADTSAATTSVACNLTVSGQNIN